MTTNKTFPKWLRVWWLFSSPLAIVLAARFMWEKTILTWRSGPQMVGFSLIHIHPLFAIAGLLCSWSLMLWLLPAVIYFVIRREYAAKFDFIMCAVAVLVAIVMVIPDTFFA